MGKIIGKEVKLAYVEQLLLKKMTALQVAKELKVNAAKKYKATTNSNHSLPVAPNLLEKNFFAAKPNMVWVSDFTYIYTEKGWQYLVAVIDLFSRKVIGWSLKSRMTKQLVIEAMEMAIRSRKSFEGVIAHSNRGSQYCSHDYQKLLKGHKIRCSMSKKGDPYDNAWCEQWDLNPHAISTRPSRSVSCKI